MDLVNFTHIISSKFDHPLTGNNTASCDIPAGYTTGGTITADGTTAYAAGHAAANAEILVSEWSFNVSKDAFQTYGSEDASKGTFTLPNGKNDSSNWLGRAYGAYAVTYNVAKNGYTAVAVGMRYVSADQDGNALCIAVELTSANTVTVNGMVSGYGHEAMTVPCYVVYKKN